MKSNRSKRPTFRLRTLLILTAVLAIYVAAYKALMRPGGSVYVDPTTTLYVTREPRFLVLDAVCQIVFAPLAQLDYKLRPSFWEVGDHAPAN